MTAVCPEGILVGNRISEIQRCEYDGWKQHEQTRDLHASMYSDHMMLFYRGLPCDAVAAALAIVHYAYAWVRTASGVNTSMVDVTLRLTSVLNRFVAQEAAAGWQREEAATPSRPWRQHGADAAAGPLFRPSTASCAARVTRAEERERGPKRVS